LAALLGGVVTLAEVGVVIPIHANLFSNKKMTKSQMRITEAYDQEAHDKNIILLP
jgi:hypothetical protein